MSSEQQLALTPHRSKFVRRAGDLRPRVLSALKIEPVVLQFTDVVVTICSLLMDDRDCRPWQERVEGAFQELDSDVKAVVRGIEEFAQDETRAAVEGWVRKVRQVGYRAYARRLLGAAEYDRLELALREDAAVVALAVRRGVRAAMPFVAAFEDGLEVMTAEQLSQVRAVDLLGLNVGQLMHKLDAAILEHVWPQLPMEAVSTRDDDSLGLEQFTDEIRAKVTTGATNHLTRVNEPLVRKLTGARDAMKYSSDGVSQAASSLVELIDRTLREGTEDRKVLEWIDRELVGTSDVTYVTANGERRPSTRGSTFYFLYGGGSVAREPSGSDDGTGPSFLHEVLASVVVVARKKLQRLKHADSTDPDEREHLDKLLAAVEGAMWLGLWLHQTGPGNEAARRSA